MPMNNQLEVARPEDRNDYRVVVLSEHNYVTWKWQMELILTSKDLMTCIKGTCTNEAKNNQAASILASSISTLNMQRVVNCKNAKEIWDALEATYENKSSSEKTALMEKFTSYRIHGIRDIGKGISELQAIAARLRSLQVSVDDEFIISILLKALPTSFDTWKSTWKMVNAEKPKLNKLITGIMAELNEMKDPEDRALIARSQQSGYDGKERKRDLERSRRPKKQTRKTDRDICWYCRKSGHWAKDCPTRKADEEKSDEEEDTEDEDHDDDEGCEEEYTDRKYTNRRSVAM